MGHHRKHAGGLVNVTRLTAISLVGGAYRQPQGLAERENVWFSYVSYFYAGAGRGKVPDNR
jgi:hypothetical protein